MTAIGVYRFCGYQILSEELVKLLSTDRFHTYLVAAGYDVERAFRLYSWNLKTSASFYPLLSSIEVCLRNQIEPRLKEVFGEQWWSDQRFHILLGRKGKGIVLRAERAISDRGKLPNSGRMTAELSFGFWVNMLLEKYEEDLWSNPQHCFQSLPSGKSRADLWSISTDVKVLRNRISHHEPIFKRDLTSDYSKATTLLGWLGPQKLEWIKPQLETMRLLRARP